VTIGSLDDPEAMRPSKAWGAESKLSRCDSLSLPPKHRGEEWLQKVSPPGLSVISIPIAAIDTSRLLRRRVILRLLNESPFLD
jgi:hypothetical protein